MRSMVVAFTLGAFLALAGVSPVLAATSRDFSGEIRKVDTAAKTLVVKGLGPASTKEMTFQVGDGTKTMMGVKTLTLASLKSGEQVKVTYVDEGALHKAQRIEVEQAKTGAAKHMSN